MYNVHTCKHQNMFTSMMLASTKNCKVGSVGRLLSSNLRRRKPKSGVNQILPLVNVKQNE